MPLVDRDYRIITFMEQEYYLHGSMPSAEQTAERLPAPVATVRNLIKKPEFKEAMLARGLSETVISWGDSNGIVTAKQLTVINTLLDSNDSRSDKKKLADLDIPTQTYQGWMKDPAFRAYWGQRCEALLGPGLSEANRAIVDNVRRGDLGSIKFLMELTGRWSSKPASEMNIEWILMKVLETIQKHVTDPSTLQAIATDLTGIQQEAIPAPYVAVQPLSPAALAPVTADKDWAL